MPTTTTISGSLAATILLVAAMPTASAFMHDHDWFDFDWFKEETTPPAPITVLEGAVLDDVAGKLQVTTVSGITTLTVLSYDDMDLYIVPKPDHVEVRQVPTHLADVRPLQVTTLNSTSTLTLVQTPYQSWYDGADAIPAEFGTDPTYIYRNRVPDATVHNVVALQDLAPYRITGGATMVTETIKVEDLGPTFSAIQLSILDVDDSLRVVEAAPAYDAMATITTASTATAIQNLLDEFSLAGIDLTGVLSGLTSSPDKVGVVNLAGVSQHLVDRGATVRKVVDATQGSLVYFDVGANRFDFVNPAGLTGEIVLLNNKDLASVDEAKINGLKNAQSPKDTRVLHYYTQHDTGLACLCMLEYVFAPSIGGITDAVAIADASKLKMKPSLTRVNFKGATEDVHVAPAATGDFKETLTGFREAFLPDTSRLDTSVLKSIGGRSAVTLPSTSGLKKLFDSGLYDYTPLATTLTPDEAQQRTKDTITSWRNAYGHFDYAYCQECLPETDRQDLFNFMGQLESFAPKLVLPLSDPELPPGIDLVHLEPNGGLVHMPGLEQSYQDVDELYSTVQMRVVTSNSKLPVGDALIELNTYMPGFQGNTVQTFKAETNTFGYASFSLTPYTAYNFTVTKKGYINTGGAGASPGGGETQGRDVRMSASEGLTKFTDTIAQPPVLLTLLAGVILAVLLVRRLRRRRRGHR